MIQFSITTLVECLKRDYDAKTYNRMAYYRVWQENSDYILQLWIANRDDTSFWKEYKDMDMSKTVWEHYKKTGNKYTTIDAIWEPLVYIMTILAIIHK